MLGESSFEIQEEPDEANVNKFLVFPGTTELQRRILEPTRGAEARACVYLNGNVIFKVGGGINEENLRWEAMARAVKPLVDKNGTLYFEIANVQIANRAQSPSEIESKLFNDKLTKWGKEMGFRSVRVRTLFLPESSVKPGGQLNKAGLRTGETIYHDWSSTYLRIKTQHRP